MKLLIITGASVGIGRETAALFQQDDYAVWNLSRRQCPLPGTHNIACDLSDPASLASAGETLVQQADQAQSIALVHNAARMRKDAVDTCADDDLRYVLETNVVAVNALNRALLPVMPRGSSVLYIGSTLSEKAVPGAFSYVTTKHAQLGMMRATCQDLMGRGIHTALICPGFTDTEMLRTHIGTDPATEAAIARMNSFNRLVKPSEIAALVHYCHHNPVINGAVLHANLGQKES